MIYIRLAKAVTYLVVAALIVYVAQAADHLGAGTALAVVMGASVLGAWALGVWWAILDAAADTLPDGEDHPPR